MAATALITISVVTVNARANLANSTFEGNDGNMTVGTSGNTDWVNVGGVNTGTDKQSGSTDNAFGSGTKEDNASVTITTGSIPPNKNDLTRFYEASQQASNGHIFLELAWERLVNIGNANLDFEISKNETTGFDANKTGNLTLNRTAGDLLVTYDFGGSGSAPALGLNTWLTAAAGNTVGQCLSANALPCWGRHVDLSGSGFGEGAVNAATINDVFTNQSLTTGLFGEAAIDLTAAGVFTNGACSAFGTTFVKSRSSSSFTAEMKDFIAPVPVQISNCGSITIRKVTQNGDSSFGYTTTGSLTPSTFSLSNGQHQDYTTVGTGSYSVTENLTSAQATAGWTLASLSCTTSGTGTSADTTSPPTVNITMGFGGSVDCTYTNHINLSPTIATTLSKSPVAIGESMHDSAMLTGAASNAGGSVTYHAYAGANTCSGTDLLNSTQPVTNGVVPDSDPISFSNAGTYSFQAVYTGDANDNGATSTCSTEQLVVNKNQPTQSTAQSLIPNDSFTLSGGAAPVTGSITFNLYSPSDPTCSGLTPAFTQTVTVSGNGAYSTTNTAFSATAVGEWRWQDSYTGNANNKPVTSACGVENFTIVNVNGS